MPTRGPDVIGRSFGGCGPGGTGNGRETRRPNESGDDATGGGDVGAIAAGGPSALTSVMIPEDGSVSSSMGGLSRGAASNVSGVSASDDGSDAGRDDSGGCADVEPGCGDSVVYLC